MAFGGNVVLKDPKLVQHTADTAIRMMQQEVEKGKDIPMERFTEVLLWENNELRLCAYEEEQRRKRDGWKVESRKWCGVPVADFEIPSLQIYSLRK